jgi:hypothetical protein
LLHLRPLAASPKPKAPDIASICFIYILSGFKIRVTPKFTPINKSLTVFCTYLEKQKTGFPVMGSRFFLYLALRKFYTVIKLNLTTMEKLY